MKAFDPTLGNQDLKVKSGRYLKTMNVDRKGKRLYFGFGFDKKLMAEVKNMGKPKWHGFDAKPIKKWSALDDTRTRFCLDYLTGQKPYEPWTKPLDEIVLRDYPGIVAPYDHQIAMARRQITSHYAVHAAEMGAGKTLAMIIAVENTDVTGEDVWFIGPRNACAVFTRELRRWRATFYPRYIMTYEKLVSVMKNWKDGDPAPRFGIFDESSKIKTMTAQRSQAAFALAEANREEHGWNGYVSELTGTPAPRTPVDWWHQCEVAAPGFLSENHPSKLKKRLCLEEMQETPLGVSFPKLITWWDDERKCKNCGQLPDEMLVGGCECGTYAPSVNEVAKLHTRMKGLCTVIFKKDCMDLPAMQYEIVKVKPTKEILMAAKLIRDTGSSTIKIINDMKQLSDGFLYAEKPAGEEDCHACNGNGITKMPQLLDPEGDFDDPENVQWVEEKCPNCAGKGKVTKYERYVEYIGSPKLDALVDELDMVADVGRAVVWCAHTGSIDLVRERLLKVGWAVLRIDGKSWGGELPDGTQVPAEVFISAMDAGDPKRKQLFDKYPKVCVVGNAASGGMAFSFTTAPVAWYYSNSNNGEARTQSEARIHRGGMDLNRGATIRDLVMLPNDMVVLKGNKAKRKLETMSMGELDRELAEAMKEIDVDEQT